MNSTMTEAKHDHGRLVAALETAGGTVGKDGVQCPFCGAYSKASCIQTDAWGAYFFHCTGCGWRGDVLALEAARVGEDVTQQAQQGPPLNDRPATHTETRGEIAECYGRRGWAVYPVTLGWDLVKGEKTVRPEVKWKDEATSDLETIRQWWRQWPDASIAIDCGRSGLWVLDVDVHGCDGYESLKQLFEGHDADLKTLTARTPSGGRHLYYQPPDGVEIRNSAGLLGPGLDTRGAGGCIFAPGSSYNGSPYTWEDETAEVLPMPGWLIDRLRKPEKPPAPVLPFAGLPDIPDERKRKYIESAVKSAVATVSNATEGNRNTALNEQAFSLATFPELPDEEIHAALLPAALTAGLEEAETTATLRSAITKGRLNPRDLAADMRRTERAQSDHGEVDLSLIMGGMQTTRPIIRGQWEPFPADLLPQTLREFVAGAAAAKRVDPALIALPAIVACSGAIGNVYRVCAHDGDWIEPLVIWSIAVAPSGGAKSPGMEMVKDIVDDMARDAEREYSQAVASWRMECQGKKAASPPPPVRVPIIDVVTMEAVHARLQDNPRGLSLIVDELKTWVADFDRYASGQGGGDSALWLRTWNAKSIRIDRKTGAPEQRHIYIPRAAVSIFGTIQPKVLKSCFAKEHIEDGMLARMCMAYPPRQSRRWRERRTMDHATVERFTNLYRTLLSIPYAPPKGEGNLSGLFQDPSLALLELTPEAGQLWLELLERHDETCLQLDGEALATWAKVAGYTLRFAGLIAAIEYWQSYEVDVRDTSKPTLEADTFPITADHLFRGAQLAEWFGHEGIRIVAMFQESALDQEDRELLDYIRDKGGALSVRALVSNKRRYASADVAKQALERLAKAGHGTFDGKKFRWGANMPANEVGEEENE